jgi:hypothetical protein
MNILNNISNFDKDYIYFYEPIKNNIMNNGKFIKIIYSTPEYMLNSINLIFDMHYFSIEKNYNKYKCIFDIDLHKEFLSKIKNIEEDILNKFMFIYSVKTKNQILKLYEQFKEGNIKVYQENFRNVTNKYTIILRISGIWENNDEYGLTYKFFVI